MPRCASCTNSASQECVRCKDRFCGSCVVKPHGCVKRVELEPGPSPDSTVTAIGEAVCEVSPDYAIIVLVGDFVASTMKHAKELIDGAFMAAMKVLRKRNIPDRDLRNFVPSYDKRWQYREDEKLLEGYRARNELAIRFRNLEALSELVIAIERASPLLRVGSIEFGSSALETNVDDVVKNLLTQAVQNARIKADSMLIGADRKRGALLALEDAGGERLAPAAFVPEFREKTPPPGMVRAIQRVRATWAILPLAY